MKLAEALAERKDKTKKLEELKQRIVTSEIFEEGEEPNEDSGALLEEYISILKELSLLISSINVTNAHTLLEVDGAFVSLTDVIMLKDMLLKKLNCYQFILSGLTPRVDYHRVQAGIKPKYIKRFANTEIQGQIDAMSKQIRNYDCIIQAANWATELK